MFTCRIVILNFIVCLVIVLNYVGIVFTSPCIRIPQGSGAGRSQSTGNFRIRLSEDSGYYKPGRQYMVVIDRRSNSLRNRDGGKPKFIGFYLAVEQKTTPASDYAEDFSPAKHGTLNVPDDYATVAKQYCGNVVTQASEIPKSEVQASWTAPGPGSGCVIFRATIIENRDFWYKDENQLSKEFCEDEENQEDAVSSIQDSCSACNEAKYELTFEGLWSRNTHPKGFPRNVYTTKFGDIIGATHKFGYGFWANGQTSSDGLQEVAEISSTKLLESELKNKSDSIRTIIKARGLSYPNITGKTFAVFRVDSENHLLSLVSTISPSPDWFVGVAALELCLPDGNWVESKVVDLYPWDAGTDDGITYEAPDQPTRPRDRIRRITSESPNNNESPFFNPSGSKIKPLARLTLLRQRLYEKNCTAEQSASDGCQVGDWSRWGECFGNVCGGSGKQYRQRYYKTPDKAIKCLRKLFETRSCVMPLCTYENEENIASDPECRKAISYTNWSECTPSCKNSPNEMGTRTRRLKIDKKYRKMCAGRVDTTLMLSEPCEIEMCVGQNKDDTVTPEPTEENQEEEPTEAAIDCNTVPYKKEIRGDCDRPCGYGIREVTQESTNPDCPPKVRTEKCFNQICINEGLCDSVLDTETCENKGNLTNYIFYNATTCTCVVFATDCIKAEDDSLNMFNSFKECQEKCPKTEDECNESFNFNERPRNAKRPRRRSILSKYVEHMNDNDYDSNFIKIKHDLST